MTDQPRLLVVDDEPEIVEYLTYVLDSQGFKCLGVQSPQEAIVLANKERFMAILSDMRMPEMSGLEMITQMRTSSMNATTPVVVLSGTLDDDLLANLERIGIIDVMSKPPEMDILVKVLKKTMKHRTQKTSKSYNAEIVKIFETSFQSTVTSHLAKLVSVSPIVVNELPLQNIEFCGTVTFFGRRLCGVLNVSYEQGFTAEFAKVMLGRDAVGRELEIFETSAGELAEQIVQAALPKLRDQLKLFIEPAAPLVVQGRYSSIPLVSTQPRMLASGTLHNKKCFMEFALIDLAFDFSGHQDSQDIKIIL